MASQLIFLLQQQNSDLKDKLAEMKRLVAVLEFAHEQQQKSVVHDQTALRHRIQKQYKKLFENKEGTYINQIKLLNDTLKQADQSYEILNRQYQQQRISLKESFSLNQKLQEQIEQYKQKIKRISQQKQKTQSQILSNFNKKLNLYEQKYQKYEEKAKEQNAQLVQKLRIKEDLYQKNQAQFTKMKELLQLEITKRKTREKEYREQINQLQAKIIKIKNIEKQVRAELNDKIAVIIEKDGKIKETEKTLREINLRMGAVEREAEKKVMKEKIVAKKAMEGLQMVRKYSDMELNKSRKKQRMYMMSQKQLISKIKDTSRLETNDNSLLTIKSSRKVSLPAENEKNKLNLSNFQRKQNSTLKLFSKNKSRDLNSLQNKTKCQSTDILDLSSISTREKHKNTAEDQTATYDTHRNEQRSKESPDVSKFVLEECSEIEVVGESVREKSQPIESNRINHHRLIIRDFQLQSPEQKQKQNPCIVQTPCFEDTVPIGLFKAHK